MLNFLVEQGQYNDAENGWCTMKRRLVSHRVHSQRKQQEVIKQLQERYEYTNLKDPKASKSTHPHHYPYPLHYHDPLLQGPQRFETSVVVSTNVRITDDVDLYNE